MHRGIATFTLDDGRCPKWLFERMVRLGRSMTEVLIEEYGPDEFIKRIADPVWFQSLGTVLAFDWNASGLTTILTAALKEAIRGREKELGVFICGGKGKTSLKTPEQIASWGDKLSLPGGVVSNLTYNSKMAAKVDSSLVQDGFTLYHHAFFFSKSGAWTVVQQGMNKENRTARRYHWHSKHITDLVREPHSGIASQKKASTLNLVARESEKTRAMSVELTQSGYRALMNDVQILRRHASRLNQMVSLQSQQGELFTFLNLENREFKHHPVVREDFSKSKYLEKIFTRVIEKKPKTYEELLAISGVGAKTMRALALVGEVLYGARPSYEDPARYSFAFGGKDSTPYPVDRKTYDEAIHTLRNVVRRMRLQTHERLKIVARLDTSLSS